jgi:hypothetical protein
VQKSVCEDIDFSTQSGTLRLEMGNTCSGGCKIVSREFFLVPREILMQCDRALGGRGGYQ